MTIETQSTTWITLKNGVETRMRNLTAEAMDPGTSDVRRLELVTRVDELRTLLRMPEMMAQEAAGADGDRTRNDGGY